jgi:hypothetical protein
MIVLVTPQVAGIMSKYHHAWVRRPFLWEVRTECAVRRNRVAKKKIWRKEGRLRYRIEQESRWTGTKEEGSRSWVEGMALTRWKSNCPSKKEPLE